jgi:hypothetical protein
VYVPAALKAATLPATQQGEVRQISVEPSLCEGEPLFQLNAQEYQIWKDDMYAAASYRPKEAAQHSQRLQAYVEAAAARAAGQLEPSLKKEMYEALGLTPS